MDTSEGAVAFAAVAWHVGFDWASDKHDVVVVDRTGQVQLELSFADTHEGWESLENKLQGLKAATGSWASLGVAIETCSGPAVERLLAMGVQVYPMNPKAASRYRDRKAPSGVKNDLLDAWSFADALRTDGHGWRRLLPEDSATQELRMLCRDEMALIEQRTALVNQLKEALHQYYPAALEAFDDWTMPCAWAFLLRFPTPQDLARKGKRTWEKFLHTHRLARPELYATRLAIFGRALQMKSPSEAVTRAKSLLATSLARQLQTLHGQLAVYRERITEAFQKHPDHDVFDSLPGGGPKLSPRLLSELGTHREVFGSPEDLACYAGAAPVTRQSGHQRITKMRRACNKVLRTTVHLWADESRRLCAWAQAYYQAKKKAGKSHAQALRCLGVRWLKILWKMWQEKCRYDEARHMRNQTTHGSWVMGLLKPSPQTPKAA
jgi:transposase